MSSKERAFLEVKRREPGYRSVEARLRDFNAVELRFDEEDAREQASRCMDCGVPFCHTYGCPLSNVIPEFNEYVFKGRWLDAWAVLSTTNPFPEFTGRICPAPCEAACVCGLNFDPVTIRHVELAIAEKAFERGLIKASNPTRNGKSVAVVGSGPAGLAAAWLLNREGFTTVVYEDAPRPGGILRYGIPNFKLEKTVIDRRIRLMEEEGVRFETRVEVGRDVSARYLHSRFDAVILAGGARKPRDLAVPGRELAGIHFAMPYLAWQTRLLDGDVKPDPHLSAQGRTVVVIGGGDTGSDCVGTALRQGAVDVVQIEILPEPPISRPPETPWPEWPSILRNSSSHKEGGRRIWATSVRCFDGDEDGRVSRIQAVKLSWRKDKSGRLSPSELPGTEFALNSDFVILAMGFAGPGENKYVEELGLALDEKGFIVQTPGNMTSVSGVFVAGDMAKGASLVVRAMADGLKCARSVMKFLEKK